MANHGPVYGLDAELAAKRAAQYDPKLEAEARDWVANVTGTNLGVTTDELFEGLKDGVVLCNLANTLQPGCIKKINTMKMPFMQMENINSFLAAIKAMGVPETDLFMTVDLYERKNENQVVQCLHSLGRLSRTIPSYSGPSIGPKLAQGEQKEWTEEQLKQGETTIGLLAEGQVKGAAQFKQDNAYNPIKYTPN